MNWYCWLIKVIISLWGLGNESFIEEIGFVSKVNEFEIDSLEKLERYGVIWLKGEVNELLVIEIIYFDVILFFVEKCFIFVLILELFYM